MAQVHTGLGWSAKGEWLASAAAVRLADMPSSSSNPDFPGQPLPTSADVPADIIAADFATVVYKDVITQEVKNTMYATSNSRNAYALKGSDNYVYWVSLDPDTHIYMQDTIGNHGDTTLTGYTDVGQTRYYTTRNRFTSSSRLVTFPNIPNTQISSEAAAAQYLATNITIISGASFFKLSSGFAVACVARWYTPEGTDLQSPILISTVPEYTAITLDGTTPASGMSTFSFLYQGARFYMSIISGNTQELTPQVEFADLRQFAAAAPSKVFQLIAGESFANIIVEDAPDPYDETAEEDGGDGEDPEDDPVNEETLPLPSVANLGFCTVYVPSQAELITMANYLWSGSFDTSLVLKLFSNPMDSIIGLSAVPLDLVGSPEQISLGGVALTGITMPKYTGRTSVKVEMGTVNIAKRFGAYLDYDPYTEFSIYLPFVGYKSIKADDIMEKTISLTYSIDILTGACVAYLRPTGGSVMYEWSGQCAIQIPVTGANWDNIFRSAVSTAVTLGTAMFAPPSAPVLAGAVASAASQAFATKPRIERSGAVSGVTGFLGQLRPYIVRTIPEAYIPADQNKQIGYPAYINVSMSSISGYNEVASVHLENIPATGDELAEIESILKGGAIF